MYNKLNILHCCCLAPLVDRPPMLGRNPVAGLAQQRRRERALLAGHLQIFMCNPLNVILSHLQKCFTAPVVMDLAFIITNTAGTYICRISSDTPFTN